MGVIIVNVATVKRRLTAFPRARLLSIPDTAFIDRPRSSGQRNQPTQRGRISRPCSLGPTTWKCELSIQSLKQTRHETIKPMKTRQGHSFPFQIQPVFSFRNQESRIPRMPSRTELRTMMCPADARSRSLANLAGRLICQID